jgi:hypothetical protein
MIKDIKNVGGDYDGKLNDLDYFNTSISLRRLEKVAYARNERLRIFHEKTRAIRAITAGILASILPTVF